MSCDATIPPGTEWTSVTGAPRPSLGHNGADACHGGLRRGKPYPQGHAMSCRENVRAAANAATTAIPARIRPPTRGGGM